MVSHPLGLPLSHPPRTCFRPPPAQGPWKAAPSWPPLHCLPGSPTLLLPKGATAQMTFLLALSGCRCAPVHLCLLSKYSNSS